jgi:hypothetical protein
LVSGMGPLQAGATLSVQAVESFCKEICPWSNSLQHNRLRWTRSGTSPAPSAVNAPQDKVIVEMTNMEKLLQQALSAIDNGDKATAKAAILELFSCLKAGFSPNQNCTCRNYCCHPYCSVACFMLQSLLLCPGHRRQNCTPIRRANF